MRKFPDRFTFQWHVTDYCNLRCKHCYQNSYNYNGESPDKNAEFLDKMIDLVKTIGGNNKNVKSHINITGGEPFLYLYLLELLEIIKSRKHFSVGILSNGFLQSNDYLLKLKKLPIGFIQISLDGNKAIHDEIRGKGSYDSVVSALKAYKKLGIPTMISFTAHAMNYLHYPHVVEVGKKYHVYKVWTDRYIPSSNDDPLLLSTQDFQILLKMIREEKSKISLKLFSETQVASDRALQFFACGGRPYSCSAGNSLLAIMPNGDVYPCRRLPVFVGNLNAQSLNEIYFKNELINKIRNSDCSEGNCLYKTQCNGGLKCLTYSINGALSSKDPNCLI